MLSSDTSQCKTFFAMICDSLVLMLYFVTYSRIYLLVHTLQGSCSTTSPNSSTIRNLVPFFPAMQESKSSWEWQVAVPSMLSIIFQCDGWTLWWKPNQTSRPPPRGCSQPSGGVKKDRAKDTGWPGYLICNYILLIYAELWLAHTAKTNQQ